MNITTRVVLCLYARMLQQKSNIMILHLLFWFHGLLFCFIFHYVIWLISNGQLFLFLPVTIYLIICSEQIIRSELLLCFVYGKPPVDNLD